MSWEFLTEDIPRRRRRRAAGMGPAIVGHAVITGAAALMAIPLGMLGAIYLNEYGKQKPLARAHPHHGRRHDRRAVDRDGPVHLHVWVAGFKAADRLRRRARPGLPDAADRHPHHRGDAPARARRAAPGQPARSAPGSWRTTRLRRAAGGHPRHHQRRAARHRPGRRRDRAVCWSPSASPTAVNWNLSTARNTALPAQIFRNAASRSPAPGARLGRRADAGRRSCSSSPSSPASSSSRFAIKER